MMTTETIRQINFPKSGVQYCKEDSSSAGENHIKFYGADLDAIDITGDDLIIVGPNGSGKSRLCNYLKRINENCMIITAQRQLTMSNQRLEDIKKSEGSMDYELMLVNPVNQITSDYGKVLSYLKANHVNKTLEFATQYQSSLPCQKKERTKLEKAIELWNSLIPDRVLTLDAYIDINVSRKYSDDNMVSYQVNEMSDGERGIFYLIGKCLIARKGEIIIIDEPELHAHMAIRNELWLKLKKTRPDCFFIFITHDMDFVGSRSNSRKIFLQECKIYSKEICWDWIKIEDNDIIPEEMLLKLLGSKKPILFVEGNNEDVSVYGLLYPNYLVQSVGGCGSVIIFVDAYRRLENKLNYLAYGVIDRDTRSHEELESLSARNVAPLGVAEVENIFLLEPVLRLYAEECLYKQEDGINGFIESVKRRVLEMLEEDKEEIICKRIVSKIEYTLKGIFGNKNNFNNKIKKREDVINSFGMLIENCQKINIDELYALEQSAIEEVLVSRDYNGALKLYYDGKKLLGMLSRMFSTNSISSYKEIIINYFTKNPDIFLNTLGGFIPDFSN